MELKNPKDNLYADLLKIMVDLKNNYGDYMIAEPIDCDEELERIPKVDYELCTALLTMLLREDHFSYVFLNRNLLRCRCFQFW